MEQSAWPSVRVGCSWPCGRPFVMEGGLRHACPLDELAEDRSSQAESRDPSTALSLPPGDQLLSDPRSSHQMKGFVADPSTSARSTRVLRAGRMAFPRFRHPPVRAPSLAVRQEGAAPLRTCRAPHVEQGGWPAGRLALFRPPTGAVPGESARCRSAKRDRRRSAIPGEARAPVGAMSERLRRRLAGKRLCTDWHTRPAVTTHVTSRRVGQDTSFTGLLAGVRGAWHTGPRFISRLRSGSGKGRADGTNLRNLQSEGRRG